VSLQTVSYLIAALSFAVTCAYYIMNLSNNKKNQELTLKAQQQSAETRQIQLFMQVMDKMDKRWLEDYWEVLKEWNWTDFDDFMKRYGPDNTKFREVFGHMMHMGILVDEGLLDPKLIRKWMGWLPGDLWRKYESVIYEFRRRYDAEGGGSFMDSFEDLALAVERERLSHPSDLSRRLEERRVAWVAIKAGVPST
jgi:hypothetical protein